MCVYLSSWCYQYVNVTHGNVDGDNNKVYTMSLNLFCSGTRIKNVGIASYISCYVHFTHFCKFWRFRISSSDFSCGKFCYIHSMALRNLSLKSKVFTCVFSHQHNSHWDYFQLISHFALFVIISDDSDDKILVLYENISIGICLWSNKKNFMEYNQDKWRQACVHIC